MVNAPKPGYYASHLAKSNEYYLLQLTKQSNLEQARAAKNQLIIENEGFLKSFTQSWIKELKFIDFDYLLEEARIVFLSAINAYDLSKDVSLRTYARFYLLNLKKQIFTKSKFVEFKEECAIETYSIPNPDYKNFDLRQTILTAIESRLSKIEQEVVYMHFFEQMKQRHIAILRKCSEARISMIIKTALPKLKEHLIKSKVTALILDLN